MGFTKIAAMVTAVVAAAGLLAAAGSDVPRGAALAAAATRTASAVTASCAADAVHARLGEPEVAGARGRRGVVDVYTELAGGIGAGTGIVLDKGLILTNAHVVAAAAALRVVDVEDGGEYLADVVGSDPARDVAVLRLDGHGARHSLASAALGDSDRVRVGDPVTAIGNAGGQGGAPAVAHGTVSRLGVSVLAEDSYRHDQHRLSGLIQVSARVEPGDSGGPLVDAGGRVIGMDTAAGPRSGFAIPINTALSVATRHGWLAGATDADHTDGTDSRVNVPA